MTKTPVSTLTITEIVKNLGIAPKLGASWYKFDNNLDLGLARVDNALHYANAELNSAIANLTYYCENTPTYIDFIKDIDFMECQYTVDRLNYLRRIIVSRKRGTTLQSMVFSAFNS